MSERRSRGRPRSFDKDEMLQIVLEEFWKRGYAATSLDDLSRATGLSRPSLYAAYGGKTALYCAALEAFGAIMERRAVPALQSADDLHSALVGFFRGALDVYSGGDNQALGCLVFSTAVADAPRVPAVGKFVRRFLDRLDHEIEACLQRCAPNLPAGDRRQLTQLAGGVLINLGTRARAGAPRQELDDIAEASASSIEKAAKA